MNLANLAMVTGHIGVENAGVNPLRGQNNVQGSLRHGRPAQLVPRLPERQTRRKRHLPAAYGVKMREKMGLRIPEMLDMAVYGKLRAMYVMGEDPALTDADANHVRKALDSLEFLVAQNLFMTETAKYADVFLPAACYAEKDGTFTNTERRISACARRSSRQASAAPTGRSSPTSPAAWVTRCATTRPRRSSTRCAPGAQLRRHHLRAHRQSRAAVALPRRRPPRHRFLHANGFTRGKGLLRGIEYEAPAELCSDEYPLLLSTGRMLYHYNIMTSHSANLEALRPHELAQINPARRPTPRAARRRQAEGHLATGLDHDHAGRSPTWFLKGRRVHDLPLPGVAGERADQLGFRPGHQDGGVQGLRGAHRKVAETELRRRAGRLTAGAAAALPGCGDKDGASRKGTRRLRP